VIQSSNRGARTRIHVAASFSIFRVHSTQAHWFSSRGDPMVHELAPLFLDALRHTSGFIFGAQATHRASIVLKIHLQLQT
jgi:hypothetical protein